ncbi:DUF5133 domain-containing protein [Streptomyces sp. NPDC057746]|uniref:DUF5133 domain-containing protein n=1 Tax=Streptomyces sp. NPDC057746 TaxID=3346237 RepID=UPI0036AC55FB
MLMAHPAVLHPLVEEYEALVTVLNSQDSEQTSRRLEDVSYTLCVATGTRDIDAALVAARFHLPGALPYDDSILAPDHLDPEAAASS